MGLFDLPNTIPWLSLIWLCLALPAFLVLLLPEDQPQLVRGLGTGVAALSLGLVVLVYLSYKPGQGYQFHESLPWLPQFGINYALAVDGISVVMLLLNGIIVLTAALMSWNIETRVRQYWSMLLLLAAGAYGVFISLDLLLLFVFYELTLFPKFLLITLWGSTRKEYGGLNLALYLMAASAAITLYIAAL